MPASRIDVLNRNPFIIGTASGAYVIEAPDFGEQSHQAMTSQGNDMAANAMSLAESTTNETGQRSRGGPERGLTVIVPVYNESGNLPALHARIADVARRLRAERGLSLEVVYVDDGSRDTTLAVALDLPADGLDVQVISLSRNFGKEAALLAGLDHARFGALLFMDGDGQHPPSLVDTLVGHWLDDGYDVVFTAKAHRENEPLLRRLMGKGFYAIINWGARQKIPEDAGDFRLLSPRAAAALRRLPERNRFFKGLASWIGFRQKRVDYEPAERTYGRSAWNFYSLIGLSIEGLTSFSVAPLRLASLLGLLLAGASLIFGVEIMVETIVFGQSVPGYPSLVVGLMVLGGVQLVMIGIMGEYIGKILSELKARPVYFIAEHSMKTASETDRAAGDPPSRSAAE
jgi:glycosyltransferase involved in cell wall biosynthesis